MTASLYSLSYGGTVIGSGAFGGSSISSAPQTIFAYTTPEPHWHEQQHKQPLEAVEGLSIAPVALLYAGYNFTRH